MVEERNGVLNLLPTMPVGAPGTVGTRAKRSLRSFVVPHIPHDDVVLPEEVQGIRAFGSETEMETIASVMARHLQTMRNKHAITLENLRMGALKGVILDADGSVIYNLFDVFGITPAVINFDLANASANIKKACANVLRHFEDNLKGEFMTAVHCLCSPEFFDALTEHPKVKDAFAYSQQRAVLIDDMRAGFTFGGVTFEEYRGQATDMNGVTRRFIAAGEAHLLWAPWTPSAPITPQPTSMRPPIPWGKCCMPSRSRASLSAAPTCTRKATHCPCVTARACWSS